MQPRRIWESFAKIDPVSVRLRWVVVLSRRAYSVAGPNALYHLDGYHGLINWGFVIHGAIDGFSKCIVYLHCSTDNSREIVADLFPTAIKNFG